MLAHDLTYPPVESKSDQDDGNEEEEAAAVAANHVRGGVAGVGTVGESSGGEIRAHVSGSARAMGVYVSQQLRAITDGARTQRPRWQVT